MTTNNVHDDQINHDQAFWKIFYPGSDLTAELFSDQNVLDLYYKIKAGEMKTDYQNSASIVRVIPSYETCNETIEFKQKPKLDGTIHRIQYHFALLAFRYVKKVRGELPKDYDVTYKSELTIYGKDGYTSTNITEFLYGLLFDLPKADGFKITSIYDGPSLAPGFNSEIIEDFEHTVEKMGKHEAFTYKVYYYHANSGDQYSKKFENGEWVDLKKLYSSDISDIIDKDFGDGWSCEHFMLGTHFHYDEHPEILKQLYDATRRHIPEDQLVYCEEHWKDFDDPEFDYDDEIGVLCWDVYWFPDTLREVQNFLDEVNRIVEPIKDECELWIDGQWYVASPPSAIASCEATKDGFRIIGTAF